MLIKGFCFGMILQIAVGPLCLFIFQTAVTSGFFTAMVGVLGVALVDAVYILAAIFGIGVLLNKYKILKMVFRYLGSIVLIVFGTSIIFEAFGFSLIPDLNFLSKQSMENVFLKVLMLTLSNPLTILFWVGVFSTRLSEVNMSRKDMYCFGLGAVLATISFLTLVSITGTFVNNLLNPEVLKILNIIVGLVLIYFGLKTRG